jgi:hypothetical protein
VLAEDHPDRVLGPAMAWARQQRASRIHVVADRATGVLARRAAEFREPPCVLHVEERTLLDAVAEPHAPEPEVPTEHEQFVELILAAGAEPVREYGVLTGEVGGLEVCRAVTDGTSATVRLEVGVGAHDREAFLLMHGEIPPEQALAGVVEAVRQHRRIGADPHPLNRLAAERLLRWRLVQRPEWVGAATLDAVSPPRPRVNVKDSVPCVAVGNDADSGARIIVVCSVGVDLDLVPYAADARLRVDPEARLLLAVPDRDAISVTRALAACLSAPAEVVGVSSFV